LSSVSLTNGFYQVGGTLPVDAGSYVRRHADELLPRLVTRGEYCNVMAARQMGKSSLIARTWSQLRQQGCHAVWVDLNAVGSASTGLTAEQWYFGLLQVISQEMGLGSDLVAWWQAQQKSTPVQRFTRFFGSEILDRVQGPIAILIDEIDSTLKLSFTDDFFHAIRSMYNERGNTPAYGRLSFVLAGATRPANLIKDRRLTPYNIGYTIALDDFGVRDAQVLVSGLERVHPGYAKVILDRILHWTDGHPYLTQKLCYEVSFLETRDWSDRKIDELVSHHFFEEGRIRNEPNLQWLDDYVRASEHRHDMLAVYRQIVDGEPVQDDERSIEKSYLKLSGLVKAGPGGHLKVRNRIYEQVFGREWAGGQDPTRSGFLARVKGWFRRR
jgi:AAA domain-containing protein